MNNPTGWVDPLGLNSQCPPGSGARIQEPSKTASTNNHEPSAPSPEQDAKYLYRGDTRSPEVIFNEGFKSKGDSEDLLLHAYDNNTPPSNFISTSTSQDVAIDFGTAYRTKKGYLYTLKTIPGRDVNKELGTKVPFPEEKEIAIPGKINSEDIMGVTPLNPDGSYVGYSIPNPNRK